MLSKTVALAALASVASGHMLMANPKPYAQFQNGPLDPSGANFPCQGIAPVPGVSNDFKAGSTQQLTFTGTAVHGGGSCQVSVTKDKNPTKDSVWKVIHSIEAGCPARNTPGNLPQNDASLADPFVYDYTVPSDLADGEYILAWTWFNKIGNREMYMNCASVSVSGGSGDVFDSLPDMFVANIAGPDGCGTKEGVDTQFPNPGKSVEVNQGALGPPVNPEKCGASGPSPPPGGSPTQPLPDLPTESPTQPPVVVNPGQPTSAPLPDPKPTSAPQPDPQPTQAPTPDPIPSPEPVPEPEPAPVPVPGGGHAAGTPCTSEGMWNCVDGTSFQRCASGVWSVHMAVAAGTSCRVGESDTFGRRMRRGLREALAVMA